MKKPSTNKLSSKKAAASPFATLTPAEISARRKGRAHVFGKRIRCKTDSLGLATPGGRDLTAIVVDSSEGVIPLWAKDTTLRWRFQEESLTHFADIPAAKAAIRTLMGKALLAWGPSVPVKFAERQDAWDFEIVTRASPDCDINGCVLASAFFPDSGRHELEIYPTMFDESNAEQVATIAHELGHVFGLRHFFAKISEKQWKSEIFGKHKPFSIMNYGSKSVLTADDRADLKKLYQLVWAGTLKEINGTKIKLVKPFHLS